MTAKSFLDFKKNRNNLNDKLMTAISEIGNKPSFEKDLRYWSFPVDKFGNGRVILHFLPSQFDEDTIVRYIDHSYKGPGGWYINKSLSTFNTPSETVPDPMAEYNNYLWKIRRNGSEAEANAAEKIYNGLSQKEPGTRPSTRFVANILIIQDFKKTDSDNGKVFLFKFGTEIFTKIQEAIKPKFEGVEPIKPFDLWEGRNLDLRAVSTKGKRSYSSSEWGEKGPVAKTEEAIEAIFKQTYSVKDEISSDKFKTYDELKKRLDIARGEAPVGGIRGLPSTEDVKETGNPPWKETQTSLPLQEADEPSFSSTPPWIADENDKELSEFQDLLNK